MDTYYIKLQGKANIPNKLEIGHNFKVICDASITGENKTDNEDGSYSITWKAEPITVEIQKDNGEVVKAKDPRRNSQKIRNYLFKIYANEGIVEDFDTVYDAVTMEILSIMPSLVREALNKIQNYPDYS